MQNIFYIVTNSILLGLMVLFFKKYYPQFKEFNQLVLKIIGISWVALVIFRLVPPTAVFAGLIPFLTFLGLMIYLLVLQFKSSGLKALIKTFLNCFAFIILANWLVGFVSVALIRFIL